MHDLRLVLKASKDAERRPETGEPKSLLVL